MICNVYASVPFVNGGRSLILNGYDHTPPSVKRAYVDALLGEAAGFAGEAVAWDVRSLTLGGGSASTLPEEELGKMLRGLGRLLPIDRATPLYATFDPGLLTVGQANRLREAGRPLPEFRYLAAESRIAALFEMPAGEVEMAKTDLLLEQVGIDDIGMQVVVGASGQTAEEVETSLRRALRSTVQRFTLVTPTALGADARETAVGHYRRAAAWLGERGFVEQAPLHFSRNGSVNPAVLDRYAPLDGPGVAGLVCLGPCTASCADGLAWSNTGDIDAYIAAEGDSEMVTAQVVEIDTPLRRLRADLNALWRGDAVQADASRRAALTEGGLFESCGSDAVALSEWGRLCAAEAMARAAEALFR